MPLAENSRLRAFGRATRRLLGLNRHEDEVHDDTPAQAPANTPLIEEERAPVLPVIIRGSVFNIGSVVEPNVANAPHVAAPAIAYDRIARRAPVVPAVPARRVRPVAFDPANVADVAVAIDAAAAADFAAAHPPAPGPPAVVPSNTTSTYNLPVRPADPDAPALPCRIPDNDDVPPNEAPPAYDDFHRDERVVERPYTPIHDNQLDENHDAVAWVLPGAVSENSSIPQTLVIALTPI